LATAKKEKRDYSKTEIALGNLAIITWGLLGATACSLLNIFAGFGFLALAAFLVYYELGKKGCLSCFYCKTCTIGMGKLFDVFFTKSGTENLNRKAVKLFPFVYLLLTALPIGVLLFYLIQQVSVFKLVLLVGILLFAIPSGVARRKTFRK
jgi:hypothetical protein